MKYEHLKALTSCTVFVSQLYKTNIDNFNLNVLLQNNMRRKEIGLKFQRIVIKHICKRPQSLTVK